MCAFRRTARRFLTCAIYLVGQLLFSPWAFSQQNLPVSALFQPVALRVWLIENNRIDKIDPRYASAVLARAAINAKTHLGLDVSFEIFRTADLRELIDKIDINSRSEIEEYQLDVRVKADRQELVKGLTDMFESDRKLLASSKRFFNHSVPRGFKVIPARASAAAVARDFADVHKYHHTTLQTLRDTNGQALINKDFTNDYQAWNIITRTYIDAEIVLTNQIIASTEPDSLEIHSVLRGGVANGLTASGRLSKTGTVSIVSLFPFLSSQRPIQRLRGGDLSKEEQVEIVSLMVTHELGHQLLRLGHPFSQSSCIMNPPIFLKFRAWAKALNTVLCAQAKDEAMQPGFLKIFN